MLVKAAKHLQRAAMDAITATRDSDRIFLAGGGEMSRLIAEFDWSKTSIGPIDHWPTAIRNTLAWILRSPIPIVTLWGKMGVMLYNDAYAGFAGARHPQILGMDVLDAWPEAADWNRQVMDTVFHRGETLSVRDMVLTLFRHGVGEPVWLNLDYSLIPNEDGSPAAVIAIVVETTAKVKAEQRISGERERLKRMFEQAPGFIAMVEGPSHVFVMANEAYSALVPGRELLGKTVADAIPEVAGQGFIDLLDGVYRTGEAYVGSAVPVLLDRGEGKPEERFLDFIYQPVVQDGEVSGVFIQGHDVTEHKRSEALREAHNKVLQLAIEDQPLEAIFEALVTTVEQWSKTGVLGSVLILDQDSGQLRHGAAPSLPAAYNQAIDGIEIGPNVGSCGTAAFTRRPVFVTDIGSDPLWADFRELAIGHGLRACWSTPIVSSAGAVLGTFAMYHREPREPTEQDLELVQVVTRTAALVIERKLAEEERKRFERQQQLLVGELNHRVKNTLAIVQSLTHQSFHSSVPADEAIHRFEGRLEALAAAHSLLTRKNWEAATIADVAQAALAPFGSSSRISIGGPDVQISPQTAVSLALALHELATNAAKYGALSNEGGRVSVSWTTAADRLRLDWREESGPPVTAPERRGFGTRMIERTLSAEFGGKVELEFRPEGVSCTVEAPLPAG
jgi:PAS domain S-box-containing protein